MRLTEAIRKMPYLIELFFNTPSHHRVHYSSNIKYLGRNHAGIFIIWDKMFGTFVPEQEHPTYGLTKHPYLQPFLGSWLSIKTEKLSLLLI